MAVAGVDKKVRTWNENRGFLGVILVEEGPSYGGLGQEIEGCFRRAETSR
jgi:hypothetical protein